MDAFRQYIIQMRQKHPELFPDSIEQCFWFHNFIDSFFGANECAGDSEDKDYFSSVKKHANVCLGCKGKQSQILIV